MGFYLNKKNISYFKTKHKKMKSTLVVLALFIVGAYCKDSCPNFMYGTDCLDICGFCGENVNTVGKTCSDIRIRGMMGSITALAILTTSVALCGWGTKFFKKPGMPLLEDEEM